MSLGVRHSNLGRYAVSFVVGAKVIVCSNGLFSGEFTLRRRHTTGLELTGAIEEGFDKYLNSVHKVAELPAKYDFDVTQNQASEIIRQAGREKIISSRDVLKVDDLWINPPHPEFKKDGIEGGVFGDIDFNPHREWIERVCREADITPHLPLWEEGQKQLMEEFIDAGFKAVVIAAKAELFGEEVLGIKIDRNFIYQLDELCKTKDITHCGEAGEYHTLVVNGPLFKKRLEITQSKKVERDGIRFLEILNTELESK